MKTNLRMMIGFLALASVSSTLTAQDGVPAIVGPEVCADVASLADGWNELADELDVMLAEGFSGTEAEELESVVDEATEATRELADFLSRAGDEAETSLAEDLHYALDGVVERPVPGELIGAMDDVVDLLDKLVEYCDGGESEVLGGNITVRYEPPADPALEGLATAQAEVGVYEQIAESISSAIALPTDLEVLFTSCGEPNAYYAPDEIRVKMCWELLASAADLFLANEMPLEEIPGAVLGEGLFTFLHELGHALVDLLELPMTGREEDSVDSLAAVILIQADAEEAVLAAMEGHGTKAAEQAWIGAELPYWDVHSMDAQRFYDLSCLVYGSDTESWAHMVGPDWIPEERAAWCEKEYQTRVASWDQLLEPHLISD